MIGIYKIQNKISGDFYIGSSTRIQDRWKDHKRDLRNDEHFNEHLQNAWNKYGEENFIFSIIEECNENILVKQEQHYIDILKPQYNIALSVMCYGAHLSAETKQKLRLINLGKHHTQETKEKCRLAGKKGKGHFTEEHKRKISEALKGHSPSNKGKKGIFHTKEWKQMMSERMSGKNNPYYGKKHSNEIKQKISNANKGKIKTWQGKHLPQYMKNKISKTLRKRYEQS
jgi:group I intron endonuclease